MSVWEDVPVEALEAARRVTARDEIHKAVIDLSRRPEADLTGAIQRAMAAPECVARDACGGDRATLDKIIKRYPELIIPNPLTTLLLRRGAPRPTWRDTSGKDASQNGRKLN